MNEFNLLQKVYGHIITTTEVAAEYGASLPPWVEIRFVRDKNLRQVLELHSDKGESSAIALAMETPDCLLILDDYKARKTAENLGLKITGTIGIFIKAKLKGLIPSIKPYLERINQTDFYLSNEIEQQALILAGEIGAAED